MRIPEFPAIIALLVSIIILTDSQVLSGTRAEPSHYQSGSISPDKLNLAYSSKNSSNNPSSSSPNNTTTGAIRSLKTKTVSAQMISLAPLPKFTGPLRLHAVSPHNQTGTAARKTFLQEVNPSPPPGLVPSNETVHGPIPGSATNLSSNKTLNKTISTGSDSLSPRTSNGGSNIPLTKTISSFPTLSADRKFKLFANYSNILTPSVDGNLYFRDEPAVANKGNLVFYVGTFYAANSSDGGKNWSYVDLNSKMPSVCCDQDVIYSPQYKIFVWSMMGLPRDDPLGAKNNLTLAISHDAIKWSLYNISPLLFNSTWGHAIFDYPQIAIANRHLYVSANVLSHLTPVSGHVEGSIMARTDLSLLSNSSSVPLDFVVETNQSLSTLTPVQGAAHVMYWATHVGSENKLRIYSWSENGGTINWTERKIPAWNHLTGGSLHTMYCPGPDGHNWCSQSDSRITSGWISNSTIGFFWNAPAGNGFLWPYVDAAAFDTDHGLKYLGRPYLYSTDHAWLYAFASPGLHGLGIVAIYGSGRLNPGVAAGIRSSALNTSTPWDMHSIANGTNAPEENQRGISEWGDYIKVRPYSGIGPLWVASGFVLHGGSDSHFIRPYYFVFGYQTDVLGGSSQAHTVRSTGANPPPHVLYIHTIYR